MNTIERYSLVVIGGSAGSIPIVSAILQALPANFQIPIIVVLHRQKNVESELSHILLPEGSAIPIMEPDDKQPLLPGYVYLAPQNYHLLVEEDRSISLDYSEPIGYSRPSIDVTFESSSQVFREQLLGILLSGANNDGSFGAEIIINNGGVVIAQDPATAEYPVMVDAVIKKSNGVIKKTPGEIIEYLIKSSKY